MNPRTTRWLPAVLLAAGPILAQEGEDWRMPFRSPQANLVPPEEMWKHLRPMFEIARKAPASARHFDETGVEVVDDPVWQREHAALVELQQDPGYVSLVLRESMHLADRAIAIYGMFYETRPDYVFSLIEHIPGEPSRTLREDGYRRAIEFLAVHLPARNPGDLAEWQQQRVGPAGRKAPRPGDYSYAFDPAPFFALLDPRLVEDPRDHAQALWFLSRCVELRPGFAAPYLDALQGRLRALLAGDERIGRTAAATFVQICDPEGRTIPPDDDRTELVTWLDAVIHTVLPPIRPISDGLVELYPSEDRDRLIAVGVAGLRDGTLGEPASGKTDQGNGYRGFRIARTPTPLDELGLPVGTTITAINGSPVATPAEVLHVLESRTRTERSFLVEFVDAQGTLRAKEFRVR